MLRTLLSLLRTLLVLLVLPPYVVLGSIVGYPLARLAGSPALLYLLGRIACRIGLFLAGTRVVVEGQEKLADPRNVVVMPNHSSHLDAPILLGLIDAPLKAVVKTELYRFPFVHYCFRFAGFIEVDRSDPEASRRAIRQAVESLRSSNCFLIFPEGRRTQTGELGEFKKGGFVVAMEAGSRIVPVALSGVRELMPRGSFLIRPGTVRVRVLDPIEAGSYSYEQRDALIAEVRGRIAAAVAG